jgi:hypothetical protein
MVPSDKLLRKLKIEAGEILMDKLPGEELGIYIYRVRSLECWLVSASGAPTKNPDVGTQFYKRPRRQSNIHPLIVQPCLLRRGLTS